MPIRYILAYPGRTLSAGLMLDHRRRQWPNIKHAPGERNVFAHAVYVVDTCRATAKLNNILTGTCCTPFVHQIIMIIELTISADQVL